MQSSTRYPLDPFNIFMILVLLMMGTRYRGAGMTGYTTQPAKEPAPPAQNEILNGYSPGDSEDDTAGIHPQAPSLSQGTDGGVFEKTPGSAVADTGPDESFETGQPPESPVATDTTPETKPATLPADRRVSEMHRRAAEKK